MIVSPFPFGRWDKGTNPNTFVLFSHPYPKLDNWRNKMANARNKLNDMMSPRDRVLGILRRASGARYSGYLLTLLIEILKNPELRAAFTEEGSVDGFLEIFEDRIAELKTQGGQSRNAKPQAKKKDHKPQDKSRRKTRRRKPPGIQAKLVEAIVADGTPDGARKVLLDHGVDFRQSSLIGNLAKMPSIIAVVGEEFDWDEFRQRNRPEKTDKDEDAGSGSGNGTELPDPVKARMSSDMPF